MDTKYYVILGVILGILIAKFWKSRIFQDILGFFYVYGMVAISVTSYFFKTGRSLIKDNIKSDNFWREKYKRDDEQRANGTYVEKNSKEIHEELKAYMKRKC
jgi:hypothetical protein